jgi:Zn-dependent oligopeptidase
MLNVILNYSLLSTSQLDSIKNTYISKVNILNEKILSLNKDELCWNNLIQPTIDLQNNDLNKAYLNLKEFHVNEEIREYCSDVATELEQFEIENNMRKDIYSIYKHYYDNRYQTEKSSLTSEQIKYFEDTMLDYKQLGLDLDDETYEKVKEIKKEISELSSKYQLNLGNYNKEFEFDATDATGLPESFQLNHIHDGKLKVNLQYPDYMPMMDYCSNRNIRNQLYYEFDRRAYDTNVELAEKIFKLRQEQAKLFGYENHSDYKLIDSMAHNTENVNTFLNNVKNKLKPLYLRDINILTELANKDGIDKLELWDTRYYIRVYQEEASKLNKEELKKFFPLERTITNVFNIYQQLLSYTFVKTNEYDNTLWHPSVHVYKVYEQTNIIGYFYLDLFPRDGKFGHAAVFPFITKSSITLPVAVMACNFAKDFMSFDELETFFHEFGHVMHHLSSKSTISATAGFSCENDFVETPSQMFEEWCYVPSTLKMISNDIDDETISKINVNRKLMQGYTYERQLFFALLDMYVHSNKSDGNTFEILKKLSKDILNFDILENTNTVASFGHLIGGYDAGYYGYMWSEAYSKDLFTAFKDKETDPSVGQRFKEQILSQGSMRPSLESVIQFLGRQPNENAFIESLE